MIVFKPWNEEVKILSINPDRRFSILIRSEETYRITTCQLDELYATGGANELHEAWETAL